MQNRISELADEVAYALEGLPVITKKNDAGKVPDFLATVAASLRESTVPEARELGEALRLRGLGRQTTEPSIKHHRCDRCMKLVCTHVADNLPPQWSEHAAVMSQGFVLEAGEVLCPACAAQKAAA